MAQSNYAALAEGLKLYTDAMRRLIKDLLSEQLGDNWLERVLKDMSGPQAQSIRRSRKKEPDRAPEDYLDANHFATIVAKRPAAFELLFPNHRQTQSLLNQAGEARNTASAHSRSGDISADDAGYALYGMIQLLERARLPEAEQLKDLHSQVMMIEGRTRAQPPWNLRRHRRRLPRAGACPTGGKHANPAKAFAIQVTLTRGCSQPRSVACSPARRETSI